MSLQSIQLANGLKSIAQLLESGLDLGRKNFKAVETLMESFCWEEISLVAVDFTSQCPPEILKHIFSYLQPEDLKAAVLVNKRWYAVGENASLWSWCKLTIQSGGEEWSSGVKMLKSLRGIRNLAASNLSSNEARQLMLAINENRSLEDVDLGSSRMNQVEQELLGGALSRLVRVNLENIVFSEEQLEALFLSSHKIRGLNLEEVDLSRASPMMLLCTSRLSELRISNTMLTQQQISLIWTAFKSSDFKIFSMSGSNLSGVEHEALVRVASNVSKIDLSNTSLTAAQVTAVATALSENLKICEIDLSDNSLDGVDPDLFASVMSRARRLSLVNTGLTAVQVNKLLKSCTSGGCPMESLDLSANQLSTIEPELLADAVNSLRDVTLVDTGLSVNQV